MMTNVIGKSLSPLGTLFLNRVTQPGNAVLPVNHLKRLGNCNFAALKFERRARCQYDCRWKKSPALPLTMNNRLNKVSADFCDAESVLADAGSPALGPRLEA